MKKLIAFIFIACLLACGASKDTASKEQIIKGDWVLNKITYSKIGDYEVTTFNDTTKECLEGSTWNFIPNNNSGVYCLNGLDCTADNRDFIFEIQEINETSGYYDFLLKPKNNQSNIGFRIELSELSESTMKWQQNLAVSGTPFIINMSFKKK
tara:strand:- start:240 stop:698 length:459 start_codon:yes stop_codon:yes gene_type:complete